MLQKKLETRHKMASIHTIYKKFNEKLRRNKTIRSLVSHSFFSASIDFAMHADSLEISEPVKKEIARRFIKIQYLYMHYYMQKVVKELSKNDRLTIEQVVEILDIDYFLFTGDFKVLCEKESIPPLFIRKYEEYHIATNSFLRESTKIIADGKDLSIIEKVYRILTLHLSVLNSIRVDVEKVMNSLNGELKKYLDETESAT